MLDRVSEKMFRPSLEQESSSRWSGTTWGLQKLQLQTRACRASNPVCLGAAPVGMPSTLYTHVWLLAAM